MAEVFADVIKGGETRIGIAIRRSAYGFTVSVRAQPHVEEFMRAVAQGRTTDLRLITKGWVPTEKTQDFRMYNTIGEDGSKNALQGGMVESNLAYDFDKVGGMLYDPNSSKVNLSFLRLVGISQDAGVSFNVRGVYSTPMLRDVRNKLGAAAKRFYVDFLCPVDLSVSISTQELRL